MANKKNATPPPPEVNAQHRANSTGRGSFSGTSNPRHLRVLRILQIRPVRREDLDRIAGCSNGPELVAELHRRGLEIPCERVPCIDRDGKPCRPGVYSLTANDRRKINRWLASRQNGAVDLMLTAWMALAAVCGLMLLGLL